MPIIALSILKCIKTRILPESVTRLYHLQTPGAFAKVLDNSKPKTVQQILAESDNAASLAAAAAHGPIPTKIPPASPVPSEAWTIPCASDRTSEEVPRGMVVVDSQGLPLTAVQDITKCNEAVKHSVDIQHTSPSDEQQGLEVCHIPLVYHRKDAERHSGCSQIDRLREA